MTDTPTRDVEDPSQLPRRTTPTWEVELLISGVAVFAMLQLPGWLDDRYFAMTPRFDQSSGSILTLVYIYAKGLAIILGVTFSLHLLLRAQWIALVGMYSVYPGGILWDRLGVGPLQREAEVARFGDRDASIDRSDNRATVVFAFGVMLASALLLLLVLVVLVFGVTALLVRGLGLDLDFSQVGIALFSALLLPIMLARLIDRRYGDRLPPRGRGRRMLSAIFRVTTTFGLLGRGSNPTFALLASHGSERRTVLLMSALMTVAFACVGISYVSLTKPLLFGSYSLLPEFRDGMRTLDAAHYADQRNAVRDRLAPFIQSATVAEEAFVRLVVPYDPEADGGALARCRVSSEEGRDLRALSLLDCLQTLRAVTLDGTAPAGLHYDMGTDPATDRPALVAMIDIRSLPTGRHELRIARSAPSGKRRKFRDAQTVDVIAFWR